VDENAQFITLSETAEFSQIYFWINFLSYVQTVHHQPKRLC